MEVLSRNSNQDQEMVQGMKSKSNSQRGLLGIQKQKPQASLPRQSRPVVGKNQSKPSSLQTRLQKKPTVEEIVGLHEDLMALHLNIIKDDAQFLRQESQMINEAQNQDNSFSIN